MISQRQRNQQRHRDKEKTVKIKPLHQTCGLSLSPTQSPSSFLPHQLISCPSSLHPFNPIDALCLDIWSVVPTAAASLPFPIQHLVEFSTPEPVTCINGLIPGDVHPGEHQVKFISPFFYTFHHSSHLSPRGSRSVASFPNSPLIWTRYSKPFALLPVASPFHSDPSHSHASERPSCRGKASPTCPKLLLQTATSSANIRNL